MLLPPSETKRGGVTGHRCGMEELSSPVLNSLRSELVGELVGLSDLKASRAALGVSPSQDSRERNAALRTAPTMPAIRRYTGVLYDALDVDSLRGAEAKRALARLAVGSALFGLLSAGDLVPAYRLSATSKLPGQPHWPHDGSRFSGPCSRTWRATAIVDLRSAHYVALGRQPDAVRVDVLAEHPDGRRTVVTHFNKAHKGRLARALAATRAEPDDAAGVAAVARRAGMRVGAFGERTGRRRSA